MQEQLGKPDVKMERYQVEAIRQRFRLNDGNLCWVLLRLENQEVGTACLKERPLDRWVAGPYLQVADRNLSSYY